MPERITSDMLGEFGSTVQGVFKYIFPKGATPDELKRSPNRLLRGIYEYFKKKEEEGNE